MSNIPLTSSAKRLFKPYVFLECLKIILCLKAYANECQRMSACTTVFETYVSYG